MCSSNVAAKPECHCEKKKKIKIAYYEIRMALLALSDAVGYRDDSAMPFRSVLTEVFVNLEVFFFFVTSCSALENVKKTVFVF